MAVQVKISQTYHVFIRYPQDTSLYKII